MQVYLNQFLPVPETVKVCDIATHEEHSQLTGEMIHCLSITDHGVTRLYVSAELMEVFKRLPASHGYHYEPIAPVMAFKCDPLTFHMDYIKPSFSYENLWMGYDFNFNFHANI